MSFSELKKDPTLTAKEIIKDEPWTHTDGVDYLMFSRGNWYIYDFSIYTWIEAGTYTLAEFTYIRSKNQEASLRKAKNVNKNLTNRIKSVVANRDCLVNEKVHWATNAQKYKKRIATLEASLAISKRRLTKLWDRVKG